MVLIVGWYTTLDLIHEPSYFRTFYGPLVKRTTNPRTTLSTSINLCLLGTNSNDIDFFVNPTFSRIALPNLFLSNSDSMT